METLEPEPTGRIASVSGRNRVLHKKLTEEAQARAAQANEAALAEDDAEGT